MYLYSMITNVLLIAACVAFCECVGFFIVGKLGVGMLIDEDEQKSYLRTSKKFLWIFISILIVIAITAYIYTKIV